MISERGEGGVKNPKNLADIICEWPPTWLEATSRMLNRKAQADDKIFHHVAPEQMLLADKTSPRVHNFRSTKH